MARPRRYLVTSGKGGVGKSSVATAVAAAIAARGHKTVLVDCDVDGPNVARLLGIQHMVHKIDEWIHPVMARENLYVYSVELHPFVAVDKLPPLMLGEAHRSLLKEYIDAIRKEKLDPEYIFFDLPANHGDELHTIAHILGEVDGCIMVTSPSVVSTDNVSLALKSLRALGFPILGVIENFAFFECEHGSRYYPLGKGHGRELCTKENVEFLGEQPLVPAIAEMMALDGTPMNNPVIYEVVRRLEERKSVWSRLTGK